jgi:dolichyldiphosphatase
VRSFIYSFFGIFFRLNHCTPLEKLLNKTLIVACSIATMLVCYGRIYLLYHTLNQVLVGAFIGLTFGILWFLLVHCILTPYLFPQIVSWRISELLLIRDTSLIPNVLFFEYTSTRQEVRSRSRKKNWVERCGNNMTAKKV